jgi:uncharacterized protein (TIGR03067 family)
VHREVDSVIKRQQSAISLFGGKTVSWSTHMRKSILGCCLLGLAVGFCCAAERDAVKAELDKLQGEWIAIRAIGHGNVSDINDKKTQVKCGVIFSGKKLTMNGREEGFTIDPSKKPKTMRCKAMSDDWCYELDGDRLVIAFGTVGQKTLPDIEGKDGNYVLIFKRKPK